ncbi:2OG-Fe(II) oxygenase-like protein 4 [Diplogelasinospora grovesii]|uniref:2OG-Fe(II) oxygenase-like protein 4 n=1 Tax=Diplogelasinospora grovesii TaxID=303347 RepID=A0AAN6N496_9PEZI|nr:2OG-Fe(II) oxygenase-like protein 4 [Diplogelasinospora grovesii]
MSSLANATDTCLSTISLAKLIRADPEIDKELLAACVKVGFFYLDCNDYESNRIVKEVEGLFQATRKTYDLPQDAKDDWIVDKDHGEDLPVCGYKRSGVSNGSVVGKKDGFEGIMVFEHALKTASKEERLAAPGPLAEQRELLSASIHDFHTVGLAILSSLSRALGLPDGQGFEHFHRLDEKCTTALGLLKYRKYTPTDEQVGHIAHTDAGSLSFVFSNIGGLQVLMPGSEQWSFIAPRHGCAIVNVGDSLQFLAGGCLRSSLHRVVPHADQEREEKYTVVYLMRPESDAMLKDPQGNEWRSVDWCNKKFAVFRADLAEMKLGSFLTGREGYTGMVTPKEIAVEMAQVM